MTVINGIEIDFIEAPTDETKSAIVNNTPLDTCLHVVTVVSNPCQFACRYILAREFVTRMEQEPNVCLYVVELAYGNQSFHVTNAGCKRHLQLRATTPLWHKENMINIGIRRLLPAGWKACAWIDADIEFESPTWALDTLKILNGSRDIVQPFSHAVDMDKAKNALQIFPSFGFQFAKQRTFGLTGVNQWHPGFAWACTRQAYERMGGLYDLSILGAGDHNMSQAFVGRGAQSVNEFVHDEYRESVVAFQRRAAHLRMGYVPGVIRHHFHGSKKNRKYQERWQILVKHQYSPEVHVTRRPDGLLIPTAACPSAMLEEILAYFKERNEDEGYTRIGETGLFRYR